MTDREQDHDDALLAAALLAQTGTTRGPAPSDAELARWVAHTLDEARRGEVDSHIAHSPEVFERAMALVEGRSESNRNGWRAPLALAATAVIAVAGLATFLRTPAPTTDAIEDAPQPIARIVRSGDSGALDWRNAAFRGGFAGAEQGQVPGAVALRIDQCLDGDACNELAGVLYRYGALLARLDRACAVGGGPDGGAGTELDQIEAAMAASLELSPWLAPARRLRQSINGDPNLVCAEVTKLKARYLP